MPCSRLNPRPMSEHLDDPSPQVARAAIRRLEETDPGRAVAELRRRLLSADLSVVVDIAKALRRTGDQGRRRPGDRRPARNAIHAAARGGAGARCAWGSARGRRAPGGAAGLDRQRAGRSARRSGGARARRGRRRRLRTTAVGFRALRANRGGTGCGANGVTPRRVARVRRGRPRPPRALGGPALGGTSRAGRDRTAQRPRAESEGGCREGCGGGQIDELGLILIDDPASDVRHAAARTLGSLDDERIADALLPGLEDPDAIDRAAVASALERSLSRSGAVSRLRDELACERPRRRRAALYALVHLDALETAEAAGRLTDDPDPRRAPRAA